MSRRTRALRDEIADINWQLSDDSERALKTMEEYLRLKNVGTYQRLGVMLDLTQMALDAQAQGRRLDEVIEGGHQAFCDAIITELPQPTVQERRWRMLRDGVGGLALLWFLTLLLPLILVYASYSSMPGLWDVVVEFGYFSTDVSVTPLHLLLFIIGTFFVARLSVSDKSRQADRLFRPRRKVLYTMLICGAMVLVNWLNWRGMIPTPDLLMHDLFVLPLGVNVAVQAVLVGMFLLLNEKVD